MLSHTVQMTETQHVRLFNDISSVDINSSHVFLLNIDFGVLEIYFTGMHNRKLICLSLRFDVSSCMDFLVLSRHMGKKVPCMCSDIRIETFF